MVFIALLTNVFDFVFVSILDKIVKYINNQVKVLLIMYKSYKYRIYPNKEQQVLIHKHLGACRWLYNYGLAKKIASYTKDQTNITRFDLQAELPILKKTEEYSWLSEINSLTLQAVLRNLDTAYKNFFRNKKGFPKFKSRRNNRQSFHIVQNTKVDFENGRVSVPKITNIKAKLHRKFYGEVKTSTISMTPTGQYYIAILVDTKEELPQKKPIDENQAIAFDLGIKSFLVASNSDVIDNPKFLRMSLRKLKKIQKAHSRKIKGSNNRNKHQRKLARIHQKVTNQRTNFLHQTTSRYVKSDYTTFCFEDLAVSNMVKNHKLAQAIVDCSWSTFVSQLTYKSDWTGKNILTIGRFEPSSKLCSKCGQINKELTLKDRVFKCPNQECNNIIDRDYQASKNIFTFAFAKQNLVNDKLMKIGQELSKYTPVESMLDLSNKAGSLKQEAQRL
jgi:putative transposase